VWELVSVSITLNSRFSTINQSILIQVLFAILVNGFGLHAGFATDVKVAGVRNWSIDLDLFSEATLAGAAGFDVTLAGWKFPASIVLFVLMIFAW
jgi:hypothetical protein